MNQNHILSHLLIVVDWGGSFRFWNYGNHSEEIFSEKFLWTKLNRAAYSHESSKGKNCTCRFSLFI